MKRLMLCLALVALVCAVPARGAEKEEKTERPKDFGVHGWGLRFGAGDGPDQVVAGVQFDFGEYKAVHLEPNIELAYGDDRLSLSGTFAVHYRFRYVDQFRPYAGAGLAAGVSRFDPPGSGSDTDFDIGLRAVGGFNWVCKNGREAFVEISTGIGFPYNAQIMAGWTF